MKAQDKCLIVLIAIGIIAFAGFMMLFTTSVQAEWVQGSIRGGSSVSGYYRSNRDNNPYDNLNRSQSRPTNYQNYQMNNYPSMLTPTPFHRRDPVGIVDPLPIPDGMNE